MKEYAFAKGTYLNDVLTDSILIPAFELAQFGEMLMANKIDKNNPEEAGFINEIRNNSIRFYKRVVSFAKENINTPVGEYIFLMYSQIFQEKDLETILPYLSQDALQKFNEVRKNITEQKVLTGQQYIPLEGQTVENKKFKLSDIVGKRELILLDFWASWCSPCIKEIPVLTELYNKYKDKGFEIVGISIDNNEHQWKQAIEKHNMTWLQIISKKEKSNNLVEKYDVKYIPYTVLIDSTGKIIGTNLRGEELSCQIGNLLN